MGAVAEGSPGGGGEELGGGRVVHLNMKLIACKYNANDMQTSTEYLWVHSSDILFLGLRIGANLHPFQAQCLVSLLFIFAEGDFKVSFVKGVKKPR